MILIDDLQKALINLKSKGITEITEVSYTPESGDKCYWWQIAGSDFVYSIPHHSNKGGIARLNRNTKEALPLGDTNEASPGASPTGV